MSDLAGNISHVLESQWSTWDTTLAADIPLCELQGHLCQGLHALAELGCIGSTGITQEVACIDPLVGKKRQMKERADCIQS